MMTLFSDAPERSAERDAALSAVLELVPEHGWSIASLQRAPGCPSDLVVLFPGGATDLIEAYCDLADRQMQQDVDAADLTGLGLTKRVRAAIALRFTRQGAHREAIRRAVALLMLPQNIGLALRTTSRTVDQIWFAAGDRSSDFSWYTKRAILGAIYRATFLFWLRDHGSDNSATLAFLDRRLSGIGRFGRAKARLGTMTARFSRSSDEAHGGSK